MNDSAGQQAVIDFLSRGEAFGRPGELVTRIDTHASVVFLVGDGAWKLKRAIQFSYLDYSTVAKREAMCRAEFTLNRRTAPLLYRGVHPVTRQEDGTLALDGDGAPVDWLIEMAQFPQDDLFDRLAERRRLDAGLMRDLADAIAAFHDAAEACGEGGFETAMRGIAEENIGNLRRSGPTLANDKIEAYAMAIDEALGRLGPALRARPMRRCHGDLHLRNICLIDAKPVLFDGIEFNDAFTCIDPFYDFAFLLMDLAHRRLDDLANRVFNRYLDRAGSEDALALLPLYLALRAGIRALVSITAMARQEGDDAKRAMAEDGARYLDDALGFLRPAKPCLVAIGGFSGSGKSTIAQALAPGFPPPPGARVLRSDVRRKILAGIAPEARLPPSAYDKESSARIYAALYELAASALASGYSAILDAAFLDPAERDAAEGIASWAGVTFVGLWAEAPVETLRGRIAARKGDASDADLRVLDLQLAIDLGPMSWRRLDAAAPVADIVVQARQAIGRDEPRIPLRPFGAERDR